MEHKLPLAVIIMGPPGSGKGTQSSRLSASMNIPKISTGDILRQVSLGDGPKSEYIRSVIATGGLVSDNILADLIVSRLSDLDCKDGFILDGYPRNIQQATFLGELLLDRNYKLLVIEVIVPDDTLIKRVKGRYLCKNCGTIYNKYFAKPQKDGICDKCGSSEFTYRSDDNELIIKERLKEYNTQTIPVLDYYRQRNLLVSVNGEKTSDEVHEDILRQIARALVNDCN